MDSVIVTIGRGAAIMTAIVGFPLWVTLWAVGWAVGVIYKIWEEHHDNYN